MGEARLARCPFRSSWLAKLLGSAPDPAFVRLEVEGGESFAAGKVVCVAKNYPDHVREMSGKLWSGASGDRNPPEDPVWFLKPASALVGDGGMIELPPSVGLVHHEVEMTALIGKRARTVSRERALDCVAGYGVGIDVTARDWQAAAKRAGLPWALSKSIDTFAPVSRFAPTSRVADPQGLELECRVNGEVRQKASTREMTHTVASFIAHVTRFVTLEPGDVLMTGTPAGVGPLVPGDRVEARLGDLARLSVSVKLL